MTITNSYLNLRRTLLAELCLIPTFTTIVDAQAVIRHPMNKSTIIGNCQPTPTPIAVGSYANGSLATTDCKFEDVSYYDYYSFSAVAGTTYTITLNSVTFNTFLYLSNRDDIAITHNDDGNGGTNAKIIYTATTTGIWYIIATSGVSNSIGAYTLSLTIGGTATTNCPPYPTTIAAGNTMNGVLTTSDCVLWDGSYYDLYSFAAIANTTYSITINSTAFNTFAFLENGYLIALDWDNNSNGGTNSKVVYTPTSSQTLIIRVNTYNVGEIGPYTLTLNTGGTGIPNAFTKDATNITGTSATLNASVDANAAITTATFNLGTTTNYGINLSSSITGDHDTTVTINKTGLQCNTLYNYRITATNSLGTANGGNKSFRTLSCYPVVTTNAATKITSNSATLNGQVNVNGITAIISFDLGTTTSYGTSIVASPSIVNSNAMVSANKTGLTCNKTYYYRVKAVHNTGTTYGSNKTFTTASCQAIDFTITNISLSPTSPVANSTFSATVTVKNQGAITGDGKYLSVWTNQSSNQVCGAIGIQRKTVGSVAAGATKVLTFTGLTAGTVGTKTLRAFVDSSCNTSESNEVNNQLTKFYSVR